jgi:hypothetical protein
MCCLEVDLPLVYGSISSTAKTGPIWPWYVHDMFNVLMGVMVGFASAVPFLNMFGKMECGARRCDG